MTGRGSNRHGFAASVFERWPLIRRSRSDHSRRAYCFAFAPAGASLADLAGVAGLRWTIEKCFERAKDDLGLDHCGARSWRGWHRRMTLVMAAGAFLAKLHAKLPRDLGQTERHESSSGNRRLQLLAALVPSVPESAKIFISTFR